jgi:hypothetical protein
MSLGGPRCTATLDNAPLRLFTDRPLMLSTPTLTALGPLGHIEALWKDSRALEAERPEIFVGGSGDTTSRPGGDAT